MDEIREALVEFVRCIDSTGGVKSDPEGSGFMVPLADETWLDLGEAYLKAKAALGQEPVITEEE